MADQIRKRLVGLDWRGLLEKLDEEGLIKLDDVVEKWEKTNNAKVATLPEESTRGEKRKSTAAGILSDLDRKPKYPRTMPSRGSEGDLKGIFYGVIQSWDYDLRTGVVKVDGSGNIVAKIRFKDIDQALSHGLAEGWRVGFRLVDGKKGDKWAESVRLVDKEGLPLQVVGAATKVKQCSYWVNGQGCNKSNGCTYAHGRWEIGMGRIIEPLQHVKAGSVGMQTAANHMNAFDGYGKQELAPSVLGNAKFAADAQDANAAAMAAVMGGGPDPAMMAQMMMAMDPMSMMGADPSAMMAMMGGDQMAALNAMAGAPPVGSDPNQMAAMMAMMGGGGVPDLAQQQQMANQVAHAKVQKMQDMGPGQGLPRNAKTALCKFHEQGSCHKGEHCTYAHGYHELTRTFGFP